MQVTMRDLYNLVTESNLGMDEAVELDVEAYDDNGVERERLVLIRRDAPEPDVEQEDTPTETGGGENG